MVVTIAFVDGGGYVTHNFLEDSGFRGEYFYVKS